MLVNVVPLILQHIRRLAAAAPSDEQLLAEFLSCRNEDSFAALVGRHGPMVLNLCRRIVHDTHTAEDVFQATFLVLADRAAAIHRRASLAGFLHGVAYRLAVRAKRCRSPNLPVADSAIPDKTAGPPEMLAWREMLGILDQEVGRLSDRYRAPLVLCYLENRTQDEAARQLGWSLNTLRRRLERGRQILEARLSGRGVTLSAALTGLLAAGAAAVPGHLRAATLAAAATRTASGPFGIVSSVSLARKGITMLLTTSGKKIGAIVAILALGASLGLGYWLTRRANHDPAPKTIALAPAEEVAQDDPVFSQITEAFAAVAANKEISPFQLLMQRAVLEAKRGHKDEAAKLFQLAVDRVTITSDYHRCGLLIIVAYNLAEAGDRKAALGLLAEARQQAATIADEKQDSEILRFAAVVHAQSIDPAAALPFAQAIPDENCRLNAFKDIAAEQARLGDVAGALRTVELIRTPYAYFKLKSWEAIAAAQLKAGDRKAAEATLALALAAVEQKRTLNHSDWRETQVEVLAHYAAGQGRAGDRDGARATFERIEKSLEEFDRPPPLGVYVTLAHAQAEAGERAEAAKTVQRFLKTVEDYEPDENAFSNIVPALIALGDFDGATTAAAKSHDRETLRQLCEALAAAGQQEKAIALAQAAKTLEARAWGLIGTARGVLNRVPPDQRPHYSATLRVAVPAKSAVPPSPQPTVNDPVQEFQNVVREYEESLASFDARLEKAETKEAREKLEKERPTVERCAERLLKLAHEQAGKPIAVDALTCVVRFAAHTPQEEQALILLRQDDVAVKNVGDVCITAVHSVYMDATERLLRAVLEKSPYRTAKGKAYLALGDFLRTTASRARLAQRRDGPDLTRWMDETFGKGELSRLREANPIALEAEAEKQYEHVVADFDDVHPPGMSDSLGKRARASLFEMRELAVGKVAPEIEGKDLDDKLLRLSDHRGKVVVVTFWATWCGPCRQMIPHEKEMVKRLKDQPFVLLGVNADNERAKLSKFLTDNPLPWRSWWDGENGKGGSEGMIARAWNVSSWPTVYVIDHRGVIRYRDVSGKDLDDAVDTLLKEMPSGKK